MGAAPLPDHLTLETRRALLEQLEWVHGRAQERRGLVYFPPTIGWRIAAFQRPHHLARAFATLGLAVVFDVSNAQDQVFGFFEVEPDVFLFKGPETLLRQLPVHLVWAFTYNVLQRTRVRPQAALVYDIIDAPEVFPYPPAFLEENHRWGLRFADAVTCVSRALAEEIRPHRPDVFYLPNACEAFRFDLVGVPVPEGVTRLDDNTPCVLYVGSLARWFSFSLVEEVVRRAAGWRFLFAGPVLDTLLPWHRLWGYPNVRYLGTVRYESVPFLMTQADVGWIPFAGERTLQGLSPLKMYEFLAAGKPVVATPFPEGSGVPGVFFARTPDETLRQLELARSQAPALEGELRAFAAGQTWLARARTVLAHLEPFLRAAHVGGSRG